MVEAVPLKPKRPAKTKFPAGFVPGATVKLKSGGALMSITDQLSGEPPAVHVVWQSEGFYFEEHTIPVACLRLATESEVAETLGGEAEAEDEE